MKLKFELKNNLQFRYVAVNIHTEKIICNSTEIFKLTKISSVHCTKKKRKKRCKCSKILKILTLQL